MRTACSFINRAALNTRGGCSTTGPAAYEDEEAGYRFGAHTFATGEYVSIRDHGGELHTFKVTSVEPLGS